MKNIFLVINKEKIYAYIVSVLTIVTLFFMAGMINSDFNEAELTSSNVIEENENVNTVKGDGGFWQCWYTKNEVNA